MPADDATPRRKRAPRFSEIAAEAGVSESTVNRVLNERGSYSAASRAKVLSAARRLGVPRALPPGASTIVNIDVLIPGHHTPFFQLFETALKAAAQMLDRRVHLHRHYFPWNADAAYARAILKPAYKRHGVMIISPDAPLTQMALAKVLLRGEPVATLQSDISKLPDHYCAGIDNYRAGATAGYWIGRLAKRKGRVLILLAIKGSRVHEDRVRGCVDVLGTRFPGIEPVISPIETRDDEDRAARAVRTALGEGPLVGIYDSGYGTPGIEATLKAARNARKTLWIGHEMLIEHRRCIQEGSLDLVIDQNPDIQILSALQYLLYRNGVLSQAPRSDMTEFSIFGPTNIRESVLFGP